MVADMEMRLRSGQERGRAPELIQGRVAKIAIVAKRQSAISSGNLVSISTAPLDVSAAQSGPLAAAALRAEMSWHSSQRGPRAKTCAQLAAGGLEITRDTGEPEACGRRQVPGRLVGEPRSVAPRRRQLAHAAVLQLHLDLPCGVTGTRVENDFSFGWGTFMFFALCPPAMGYSSV